MDRTNSESELLKLDAINAYYGTSHILFDLSLAVSDGEVVCLLGRNGAGKTTTLLSILGLATVKSGRVWYEGKDVQKMPPYRMARNGIGYVPAGGRVFPNLTVRENLEIVRGAKAPQRWTVQRVFDLFPRLGDLANNAAGGLSGGLRQMLVVGRALMGNPRLLLLDEPTEGLAPIVVRSLEDLFLKLKGTGVAMLLCEQNHRFALKVSDRAYLIDKGQIRYAASTAQARGSDELHRYLGV